MAITWKITNGTDTVDLASGAGFQGRDSGSVTIRDLLPGQVAQEIRVNLMPTASHDAIATLFQTLWKLLNKAKQYKDTNWQNRPVYLEQKLDGETNTRYAKILAVPEFEQVELLGFLLKERKAIKNMGFLVVREHPWRSAAPGVIGSALTLGASDGAASPTRVHISNSRDDVNITDFKQDDGGAYTDLSAGDTLFPAVVAQNDRLLIGSTDQQPKHIVLPILGTAGDLTTTTYTLSYYNGAAMTALVLGTDYTCYPGPTLEDCLEQATEDIVINIRPPSNSAKVAIDGSTAYWTELKETNAAPSYATNPVQHATVAIYAQSHPYVEIPAATIKGDSPPTFLFRMRHAAGGDENERWSSTSRILMGVKASGLTKFVSNLNAGEDDNPAEWTTTQKTDATKTALAKAPAGQYCHVDFSGDSTWQSRVEFKGDDILDEWEDEYIAIVRCEQTGGAAGDIEIKLRTFIGDTDDYDMQVDTPKFKLEGVDQGPEAADLGLLTIPFTKVMYNDSLGATDLIFQIMAQRTTGSGELKIYDLILIPIREGQCGVDDPVSSLTYGPSALRGSTALDLDAGVIDWRAQRYTLQGSTLVPSVEWTIMNQPPKFERLATKTRVYFLMLHYPTTWFSGPLIAEFGMHLSCELYGHYRYGILRGSD